MKAILLPLVSGLLVSALLSCQREADLTDKERLQGTWQLSSGERAGEDLQEVEFFTLHIDGNRLRFDYGIHGGFEGTLKLDHGRSPKVMDFVPDVEEGSEQPAPLAKGIYQLEGDTLTWCNAAPGVEERPTEFSTSKENKQLLAVMKRVTE